MHLYWVLTPFIITMVDLMVYAHDLDVLVDNSSLHGELYPIEFIIGIDYILIKTICLITKIKYIEG